MQKEIKHNQKENTLQPKEDIVEPNVTESEFKELLKKAAQPVPKELDKPAPGVSYSEKQTHPRSSGDTSAKRRDTSR